ncbi:hypothetical protein [Methylocystis parvus]|uniref:hypothetical protein n=1 Tax=Methylocystis parvus TaxID=134 RepID=UPI003C793132
MGFINYFSQLHRCGRLLAPVLVVCAWSTAAEAGFFEDLFGDGGETKAAPAAPAPQVRRRQPTGGVSFSIRANISAKDRRSIVRKSDDASDGGSKPQKTVFCAQGLSARANPDSDEVRLHDGTLRAGDSLVTADGILVFKGRAACPHTASDFVGLAQSKLPVARRNALEQLEHTMQTGRSSLVLSEQEKDDDAQQVASGNNR